MPFGMHAGKQRDKDGQRDADVHEPEERAEPPVRRVEQCERRGVPERERFTDREVEEEPDDAGAVGVAGDDRAQAPGGGRGESSP